MAGRGVCSWWWEQHMQRPWGGREHRQFEVLQEGLCDWGGNMWRQGWWGSWGWREEGPCGVGVPSHPPSLGLSFKMLCVSWGSHELGEPRAGGGTELSHRLLSSHSAICVKHTHMVMFYSNFLESGANTEACRFTFQCFLPGNFFVLR